MSRPATTLSRNEFLTLAVGGKEALRQALKGQSFSTAMDLRRRLQAGLAAYAKGKQHGADTVQLAAIEGIQAIEKWTRQAFFRRRVLEIQRTDPGLLTRGKSAKWLVRKEWEDLVKRWSY